MRLQVESNAPAYHQWHSKFPSQSKKWYHISYDVIAGCSSPKMVFNSAFENKNSWIQIELNVEIGSLPPTQGIYEMPHPPSPTPPPPQKNPCKLLSRILWVPNFIIISGHFIFITSQFHHGWWLYSYFTFFLFLLFKKKEQWELGGGC